MQEARVLDRMGFEIPPVTTSLALQDTHYLGLVESLSSMLSIYYQVCHLAFLNWFPETLQFIMTLLLILRKAFPPCRLCELEARPEYVTCALFCMPFLLLSVSQVISN